jgi:ABC-type Mn2+/Zn2+ transport system ATPase subunit
MSRLARESTTDYILEVSDLTVKLKDQTILDNVSFKLKRGTTLAIVGPNGAGKTVLFRALLNLVPYKGKIEWKERVKIGYVPQRVSIGDIPISVQEFLSFKKPSGMGVCLGTQECLSLVGLDSERLSNRELRVLSGGQLQRVLIAWAIADRPNVLLFDEPTAGVDLDSEEAIYEMLNRLERENQMTVLLISHDIHVIRDYSEYMLALNRSVIYYGGSEQIADPSLLQKIYGSSTLLKTRKERE